jgi:hypothetical protein
VDLSPLRAGRAYYPPFAVAHTAVFPVSLSKGGFHCYFQTRKRRTENLSGIYDRPGFVRNRNGFIMPNNLTEIFTQEKTVFLNTVINHLRRINTPYNIQHFISPWARQSPFIQRNDLSQFFMRRQ